MHVPKLVVGVCSCMRRNLINAETKYVCRNFTSNVTPATSQWSSSTKTHDWNRAVLDAEKMVGQPTTFFSLKCLLSEEFSNVAMHLRKLIGTDHPILKTAKRLVYHGRTNMQTRGLVVLLLSKAAGHAPTCPDLHSLDEGSGVTERQQTLAEITEMIHTAHLIHKGILNLSPSTVPDENSRMDLQLGNKVSILSGDYLLANACKGLADLRNCKVVDLISQAIADFMRAEFLGDHDKRGQPLPTKGADLSTWEERCELSAGSLLANSCKSALELAGFGERLQEEAFMMGRDMALAWQVYSELQPFVDAANFPPNGKFDLTSLPVILHFEQYPHKVDDIRHDIADDVSNFDFKTLREAICSDGRSVDGAVQQMGRYSQNASRRLEIFGASPASKALSNIIRSIGG